MKINSIISDINSDQQGSSQQRFAKYGRQNTALNTFYYKKSDSLESIKEADTNSIKRHEIAEELVSADGKKSVTLFKLQKEYDSLEVELKKY